MKTISIKYLIVPLLIASSSLFAMESPQKLTIQDYMPARDEASVKRIFDQNEHSLYVTKSGKYDPEVRERAFKQLVSNFDKDRIVKVLRNGDVKAFATYYFFPEKTVHKGYIESIASDTNEPEEATRLAYEKQLLHFAIDQLKKEQPDKITSFVRKDDNRGIELLKEAGFVYRVNEKGEPLSFINDTSYELEIIPKQ